MGIWNKKGKMPGAPFFRFLANQSTYYFLDFPSESNHLLVISVWSQLVFLFSWGRLAHLHVESVLGQVG